MTKVLLCVAALSIFTCAVSRTSYRSLLVDHIYDSYSTPIRSDGRRQLVIDMISIASNSRPDYYQTQQRTFGSHPSIRHFHVMTESNDTEATCVEEMTDETLKTIAGFHCLEEGRRAHGINETTHPILMALTTKFYNYTKLTQQYGDHASGWLCAQKRPIDGLYNVLSQYKLEGTEGSQAIPDYLVVMDDDTWFNMERLIISLLSNMDRTEPGIAAGCLIIPATFRRMHVEFNMPWGGFGSVLSHATIKRMIQPIKCERDHDICKRIQQNQFGEVTLFEEGMSIADLMHKYTFDQPFKDAATWNDYGYCFHSDMTISYFMQYLTKHPWNMEVFDHANATRGENPKCKANTACSQQETVCHYMQPDQVESLHNNMGYVSTTFIDA